MLHSIASLHSLNASQNIEETKRTRQQPATVLSHTNNCAKDLHTYANSTLTHHTKQSNKETRYHTYKLAVPRPNTSHHTAHIHVT